MNITLVDRIGIVDIVWRREQGQVVKCGMLRDYGARVCDIVSADWIGPGVAVVSNVGKSADVKQVGTKA